MSLPTKEMVLAYYDSAPHAHKTPKGFERGSVARAVYIDWFVNQIPDGFTSPRGHVRTSRQDKRFAALYTLERALYDRARGKI